MADRTCSIEGCEAKVLCRGWCRRHYTRWYETGSTDLGVRTGRVYTRKPIEERFWLKVQKTDPESCWWWTGGKTKLGYGMIWDYDRKGHSMAHRVAWELHHGPIPDGLHIDHLCRHPSCVNPAHLEPVTRAENARRGLAPLLGFAHNRAKTACSQGHMFTPENTYLYKDGRVRVCRRCAIDRSQERRRNKAGKAPE